MRRIKVEVATVPGAQTSLKSHWDTDRHMALQGFLTSCNRGGDTFGQALVFTAFPSDLFLCSPPKLLLNFSQPSSKAVSARIPTALSLFSRSVLSDSLWPRGLYSAGLLCPWTFPGNTGVGCHCLLQGTFHTQGLNPRLLHLLYWQAGSLPLRHQAGQHRSTWPQCTQLAHGRAREAKAEKSL